METEKKIKDTNLIKQIVNDSNSVQDLNDLESHLKLKGEEENTKKFRPVLKDIRRRKFELKGMIKDDKNDVILPETEEKPPQFYTKDTPANSPDEIPHSEFIEAFDEPEYKKELYNALVDIYTQYRDRDPSMNVSPVKKELKTIFTSPNITNNHRIKHFSRQVTLIKNHTDLVEFLRSCLINFTKVFDAEIQAEIKRHAR